MSRTAVNSGLDRDPGGGGELVVDYATLRRAHT
jgi:hypothetical protein